MSSRLKPDTTFAILMGSSQFEEESFVPIPPVVNNLRDLQEVLADKAILGLNPNHIRVIENQTSTRALRALRQYADEAKASKATTLLFYYAGHGYRRTDNKYFLTATDSHMETINIDGTSGVSYEDAIKKILKDTRIAQHIIIIDACSSGTIAQGDETALPDIDLKGSYTLTSSADRQASFFDEQLRPHTFFTAELLDMLRQGIDSDRDSLTLAELYAQLQQRMKARQYAMSPQQKTTQELQPHTYTFCRNKAFDGEKKRFQELETEIQEAVKDLEAGALTKAKRNLKGILDEIEEDLTREDYQAPLRRKVEAHLAFCEHYKAYKPIFEKILGTDQHAALAAAQTEVKTLEAIIAQLKQELTAETTLLNQTTADLAKLQTTSAAKEQQLQATVAKLEKELARTQSERTALIALQEPPKPLLPPAKDDLIFIEGGTYKMGDVMGDNEKDNETVHPVTLSDFYLGAYAVTFAEYDAFCEATGRTKPDDHKWGRDKRPVINVSWYDAVEYCNWLSEQQGLTPFYTIDKTRKDRNNTKNDDTLKWVVSPQEDANGYRLPTEAEWEYAARQGGQTVRFGNGKDVADPQEINFNASESYKKPYSVVGEYRSKTVPVGSLKSPNTLGLHDMSGNVWEWCADWYGAYSSKKMNPLGAERGATRVLRGGSWDGDPSVCRTAYRNRSRPTNRYNIVGFRLARS
jgi:formylglycine-generating enzyme required for sulfatase activity